MGLPLRPDDPVNLSEFLAQDMTIEEKERIERLILSG
jgi:hypothetical protein